MEFIVKFLLYDSDSKFFYSFAFYFLLFRITFYFFFYLCPIPSVYSNQQSTTFATIVSEALFCLCRGIPIFITLLGCDRISGHIPRLFILFIFSYFSLWILYIAGARETQEDTL